MGKKLVIMQPYFMPYIGYFQLMKHADTFIFLDDVNFINRGWINRNKILVNFTAKYITIPLKKASQNKLINQIEIADDASWKSKMLKTIEFNYKKAPNFESAFGLIQEVLNDQSKSIADFNFNANQLLVKFLELNTKLSSSSREFNNRHLKGKDRILDICKKEGADEYINLPGGKALYSNDEFTEAGIQLRLLEPQSIKYTQYKKEEFTPWLSIIDVIMFNTIEEVNQLLNKYDLT